MPRKPMATEKIKGNRSVPIFGLVSIFSFFFLVTYLGFVASKFYYLFDIQSWPIVGWFAYVFFYFFGPVAAVAYFHDLYPAVVETGLSLIVL